MAGQAELFEELFATSYRTLVRFIFYRVNDREVAEDLASDVYRIAWEKHQAGIEINLAWLFKTARNVVGNEYRRRERDRDRIAHLAEQSLNDFESWGGEVRDLELRDAMRALRAGDALVLQLTYWEGLSSAEASIFLGCTTPAYWVRLTRARASLRKVLEESQSTTTYTGAGREQSNG